MSVQVVAWPTETGESKSPIPPLTRFFSASSYVYAPLPANAAIDATVTPGVQARMGLAATRGNATINFGPWSCPIYIADANTPRVPVHTYNPSWDQSNPQATYPPYARPLNYISAEGVPIPPGHADFIVRMKAAGDTDLSFSCYDSVNDQLWEFWRLEPCDPGTNVLGASWMAREGGRMSLCSTGPGRWRNRYNGGSYATVPASAALRKTYEKADEWGSMGSKLPFAGTIITNEDIARSSIDHVLTVNLPTQDVGPGVWWPATRTDGNIAGVPIQEAMILRLPASVDLSGLHPVAQMIGRCAKSYGLAVGDKTSGAVTVRAEPGVEAAWTGTPRFQVLQGFPWTQLEVLSQGSDGTPHPLA